MEPSTPETPLRRSLRPRRSTFKSLDFNTLKAYRSPKKLIKSDEESNNDSQPSDSEDEKFEKQTDTVSKNAALAGKEIYSFNKRKKHSRLISTPIKTPKSKKEQKLVPKTPHRLRKEIGKGIKSTLKDLSSGDEDDESEAKDFADSGSNYSSNADESTQEGESAEEDTQSEDEASPPKQNLRTRFANLKAAQTPIATRGTKPRKTKNYVIKTDEYFSHTAGKATTSNHTLDQLKTPRLSQDELQKLLMETQMSKVHQKALLESTNATRNLFAKWWCLLHENYNILLYGLGSKMKLLNDFQQEVLFNSPVVVINGFFPSLTLKDILDAIVSDLLEMDENTANINDALELIENAMDDLIATQTHLYIIVHNIEGDMLRNNKTQNVLSRLAAITNVHLIASIDHINAPLIWDHNKLSKFNFIWYDVTTFLPYTYETSFESSMMIQRTGNLALSSLRNVFLSLTSNSKGIFTIIMKYQLENNTNQYYQGLLFKDLYSACREAFLVSSDLALRAQLTEFIDHKMVKMKRSADGAEYLIIPIANNLMQQFLNEQKA